ncbi:MAG: acetyl-CoA carboxylase biotin carboxyl carrier protein subunit [Propionibacteriaceae bacterium]|jgi:methylmalonyl-CoA carboxyltransferase small subunit|nr:acetyl-CoA carboxylase biotin carboxyl carrier protein subunit [Propionibacteriaceae bacterium]
MKLKVTVNDVPYEVAVETEENYQQLPIINMAEMGVAPPPPKAPKVEKGTVIEAPLSGSVRRILVEVDDVVEAGDVVALLEAMKMETEITAPVDGKIAKVYVEAGSNLQGGDPMIEIL